MSQTNTFRPTASLTFTTRFRSDVFCRKNALTSVGFLLIWLVLSKAAASSVVLSPRPFKSIGTSYLSGGKAKSPTQARNFPLNLASSPEISSGFNVVMGVTLIGGLIYGYKKRNAMQQQFDERIAELQQANQILSEQRNGLKGDKRTLEASNCQLTEFAYSASHDLQTPLRGIANYALFLKEDFEDKLDEFGMDYIDRIISSAGRMQNLIVNLLEYSKVESQQAAMQSTDLNLVFDNVVDLLESEIDAAAATISCDKLPTINCDAEQMSQLFRNLVSNGLKFRSQRPPEIHVSVNPGDVCSISVRDNGIGIEPEFHSRIFDIFRRLHTQQEFPGTGIGLALCRRITERHGGTISVQSSPDHGSEFSFTLPNHSRCTSEQPTENQHSPSQPFLQLAGSSTSQESKLVS